jgi:glycine/D-amino acid oxidase-like deaminating enzyme
MNVNQIQRPGTVHWLEEAMAQDDQPACPPLSGTVHADVCIVGGGYLGMWTAIEILEQAPDTRVVLLEADFCGSGASGRNGGWVTGWHDSLDVLIDRFGVEEGLRLAAKSAWTIDRIAQFSEQYDIDCRFRQRGATKAAVTPVQMTKWRSALAACQRHGRGQYYTEIDGEQLRNRTGSPLPLAGVIQTDGATLQPALLARGMRRVALQLGAQIYEGTKMVSLDRGRPARIKTPKGAVVADQVVLATGAWMAGIRELRRAVIPVGSSLVATEPLGPRITERAWADGEALGDCRLSVHYMQVTPDGRLIFGRGGGPLGPGGRVLRSHFCDHRTIKSVIEDLHRWFPDLADARITHGWSGPVDRTPTNYPFIGTLGDHGSVHYATGLSGTGVGPSAYLGQTLAKIVRGIRDEDTQSGLVSGPTAYLPPEPFRSVGGACVRATVEAVEKAQELRRRPTINLLLKKLIGTTTPRALEPRLRDNS